jgi:DcuC family C4-dicarboxylate transporter
VGYTTMAVFHYFVQRWFDKRDKVGIAGGVMPERIQVDASAAGVQGAEKLPILYAFLPTVPLVLLLTFSLAVKGFRLDVVTVMILSFVLAVLCEVIRTRSVKKVMKECMLFFDTMGKMFATVISLIVAGETFAQGLTATGAVDVLISGAQSLGFGGIGMTIIMTVFIVITTVVMGSGNAPFFAFAGLVPKVAATVGIPTVAMILPMQLCVGAARALSPIVAIVVAVAGIANISPIELVKRTAIPVTAALITTTIASLIIAF